MSCGVGHRCSSDLALLWLWQRLAATVPINPLPWKPQNDINEAQKKEKKKKKKKNIKWGVPVMAQWLTNPTRNHEVAGSIPGLAQWVKDPALP